MTVVNDQLYIIHGVDESGFPFWESERPNGTYICCHYRRDNRTPRDTGNGRLEIRGWRGDAHGKSSRVGMKEKAQWLEEAFPPTFDRLDAILEAQDYEDFWGFVYGDMDDWSDYATPEKQAEMESYNRLVAAYWEVWHSISHWDFEEKESVVTLNVWTYSRVFNAEVMMLEDRSVVNRDWAVVASYPIRGEAREQEWLESLAA
jgi:hypothetical protein